MTDRVSRAGSRGAIWRRWEPHIHAPGTVLADNFPKENGWERYLDALEAVSPPLKAIGVTDYCITRSYECLKGEKENRLLSVVRSRTDKIIELSRAALTVPRYGESNRLVGVD